VGLWDCLRSRVLAVQRVVLLYFFKINSIFKVLLSNQTKSSSMKKQITPTQILQWQTAAVYAILLAVLIVCLYQLPEIAEFFKSYSIQMKAAFPQPR
jgi:hypothetical protein